MPPRRTAPAGLISVGFQTFTLSNSTAVGVNTTVKSSHVLDVSVETNSVRYRADGTNPTLTTGVLLATGRYRLEGFDGSTSLKFQRSTGSAKVSIQGFKYPGDGTR